MPALCTAPGRLPDGATRTFCAGKVDEHAFRPSSIFVSRGGRDKSGIARSFESLVSPRLDIPLTDFVVAWIRSVRWISTPPSSGARGLCPFPRFQFGKFPWTDGDGLLRWSEELLTHLLPTELLTSLDAAARKRSWTDGGATDRGRRRSPHIRDWPRTYLEITRSGTDSHTARFQRDVLDRLGWGAIKGDIFRRHSHFQHPEVSQ